MGQIFSGDFALPFSKQIEKVFQLPDDRIRTVLCIRFLAGSNPQMEGPSLFKGTLSCNQSHDVFARGANPFTPLQPAHELKRGQMFLGNQPPRSEKSSALSESALFQSIRIHCLYQPTVEAKSSSKSLPCNQSQNAFALWANTFIPLPQCIEVKRDRYFRGILFSPSPNRSKKIFQFPDEWICTVPGIRNSLVDSATR